MTESEVDARCAAMLRRFGEAIYHHADSSAYVEAQDIAHALATLPPSPQETQGQERCAGYSCAGYPMSRVVTHRPEALNICAEWDHDCVCGRPYHDPEHNDRDRCTVVVCPGDEPLSDETASALQEIGEAAFRKLDASRTQASQSAVDDLAHPGTRATGATAASTVAPATGAPAGYTSDGEKARRELASGREAGRPQPPGIPRGPSATLWRYERDGKTIATAEANDGSFMFTGCERIAYVRFNEALAAEKELREWIHHARSLVAYYEAREAQHVELERSIMDLSHPNIRDAEARVRAECVAVLEPLYCNHNGGYEHPNTVLGKVREAIKALGSLRSEDDIRRSQREADVAWLRERYEETGLSSRKGAYDEAGGIHRALTALTSQPLSVEKEKKG